MKRAFIATAIAATFFICSANAIAQSKGSWTPPKVGIWLVTAKDVEGIHWSGRLHLAHRANGNGPVGYRGYFYWISRDKTTSGREYITGSFDRRTGKFRFRGYRVRNIRGELGTGNYRASVRGGRAIHNGSWGGGNSIPGTWSAVWIGTK